MKLRYNGCGSRDSTSVHNLAIQRITVLRYAEHQPRDQIEEHDES